VLAIRLAVEGVEVVPDVDRVHAQLVGLTPGALHRAKVGVLRLNLYSYTYGHVVPLGFIADATAA